MASLTEEDDFDKMVAAREERHSPPKLTWSKVVEIGLYLLFLATFSLVVLNMRNPTYSFAYNELMKDLFLEEEFPAEFTHILKTYHDVATEEEFWQFMLGVFVPNMFSFEANETGLLYGTNRLVGAVRLRQNRVKYGECKLPSEFEGKMPPCLPRYRESAEATEPYGGETGDKYVYQSPEELDNNNQLARLQRFEGGGYVIDLNPDYVCPEPGCEDGPLENAMAIVTDAMDSGFVDVQTRAFWIDFSTYNANINMFFVGQIAFEFLPSGGILPSDTFRVFRLYNYEQNITGTLTLVGEVLLCVFIIFYFVEEVRELAETGKEYFKSGWNFYDLINLILFIVAIGLRIQVAVLFNQLDIEPASGKYYNFRTIQFLVASENNIIACNGFLLWFKIFKYTEFSPQMSVISRVIVKSSGALLSFLVMFAFVMFGFAQAGNLAFGTDVEGYGTFGSSFYTLLVSMLGEFDFRALQESNRAFGPFFFFSFIILVFFIILSMFLAIVDNAYQEVQEEIQKEEETESLLKMGAEMLGKTNVGRNLMRLVLDDEELARLEQKLLTGDTNQDGRIDRAEAAEFMGDNGDLFAEFDKDGDQFLDSDEVEELRNEVARRRAAMKREMQQVSKGDVNELDESVRSLNTRIKTLEDVVLSLDSKFQAIINAH